MATPKRPVPSAKPEKESAPALVAAGTSSVAVRWATVEMSAASVDPNTGEATGERVSRLMPRPANGRGMKRVRFRDPAGNVRGGRWATEDGDAVVTAAAGPYGRIAFGDETFAPDEVDILPPCEPTKVVCVGLNYADHAEEQGKEVPDRPLLFLKAPNAVTSHGTRVTLPKDKERIDFEAELGVVIGEQCRNVDAENAMDAVAGFTCVNDLSNRDDQMVEQNWVRGKAFDDAAPMGPLLATPEHVPEDAAIRSWVNGDLKQESSRDQFIFSVPELIEEITTYMTLEPGDVISTGTPAGVGPLSDGDTVEIEVEGVATLRHTVKIP
jgi:2-keto-4-pentenoate hydratase/2-oxohepta-3-ene-1,7-dioic acid hydratase in catechol pathway